MKEKYGMLLMAAEPISLDGMLRIRAMRFRFQMGRASLPLPFRRVGFPLDLTLFLNGTLGGKKITKTK